MITAPAKKESDVCPTCKGRGRWQEQETGKDGIVRLVWKYCNGCDGRGVMSQSEDDFNLGDIDEED